MTSQALPIRRNLEPGCMTMTWEPRLEGMELDVVVFIDIDSTHLCGSARIWVESSLLPSRSLLDVFLDQIVCVSDLRYVELTCFGFALAEGEQPLQETSEPELTTEAY